MIRGPLTRTVVAQCWLVCQKHCSYRGSQYGIHHCGDSSFILFNFYYLYSVKDEHVFRLCCLQN